MNLLISFFSAAVASFLIGFWIRRQLLRWNIIDRPNERSSHTRPTARGGGIGIMLVITVGSVILGGLWEGNMLNVMVPVVLLVAVLSFVDDLKSVTARLRFGCHALAALAALHGLGWPHMQLGWDSTELVTLSRGLTILICFLWLVGYTNAFNFMDGINGIAAGQACITAIGAALIVGAAVSERESDRERESAVVAIFQVASASEKGEGSEVSDQRSVVSGRGQEGAVSAAAAARTGGELPLLFAFVIAGAAAGFLPHNFPRARMFMGDVSSAPLGFLLAALTLWLANHYGWWLLVPLALLHANFVLDTGITLIRRLRRREKWYAPHREHFYQRLVRSGKSHAFVTGIEMILQAVVLGLMLIYVQSGNAVRIALALTVIALWGAFFFYSERTFQRHLEALDLELELESELDEAAIPDQAAAKRGREAPV